MKRAEGLKLHLLIVAHHLQTLLYFNASYYLLVKGTKYCSALLKSSSNTWGRGACVTPARAVTKETTFLINRPQFVLSNNYRPLLSLS